MINTTAMMITTTIMMVVILPAVKKKDITVMVAHPLLKIHATKYVEMHMICMNLIAMMAMMMPMMDATIV